jgi:CDP-glucose 4,6-dehydratase
MENSKYWNGRNVLVTGANGFIGGNLVAGLVAQGANVTALIRRQKPDTFLQFEKLDRRINVVRGDLADLPLLKDVIVEEGIQDIFHLAAQVEVGVARAYPFATWETNVRGTYTLMEAIREQRDTIQSVVVASSDKAYGSYPQEKMPYQEDYPLIPVFPYDVSKACADLIAKSYASDLYRLPIVVTRFCNIFGPGQLNFSAVIPDSIRSALGYTKFVPRGTGDQIRDFIYAGDVVQLYLKIAEALAKNPQKIAGEVFNAGTNQPKKIKDVVQKIYTALDRPDLYREVNALWKPSEPSGEIDCQFMDYQKVNQYFGWKPETSFDEGLMQTIQWFKGYLSSVKSR